MDKNQAIGMGLIMALLLAYFAFFRPQPPVSDSKVTDVKVQTSPEVQQSGELSANNDSLETEKIKQELGDLSAGASGTAEEIVLENNEMQVTFNSKGGIIESVLLKKYLTDTKQPLYLITPQSSDLSLKVATNKGEIELTRLFYTSSKKVQGDTTVLVFTLPLTEGKYISHTYKFPKNGYTIGYDLAMVGTDNIIRNEPLKLNWVARLPNIEYDLSQSRLKTTVNYYTVEDGFDYLSESESGKESETLNGGVKWVSMKQKFFSAAIIAERSFEKAYVEADSPSDTAVVKTLTADLTIPIGDVKTQKGKFKYYFGPNHFQTLKPVAEDFHKNVNLGWPVINWINRFIVIPTFNFFDQALGTMAWKYGIIIIILALLVKLITLPLSYKSYISMAKMKVLKPELDVIKEKYGDDMQKVQAEQMSLYSKVGINPLSGCIPVLLSMPVLLAMFSFFPNSIELRQESFLWAHDLSTYDAPIRLPFHIPAYGSHVSLFTLLMTLSTLAMTFFNSQMTTATGPMKSISYIMPLVFLFVLNSFPAGLSFYYLISNLLTIGQQAVIKNFVNEDKLRLVLEENRKKNASGEGKKSKFMNRVQEAMKAREEMMKEQQKKNKGKK